MVVQRSFITNCLLLPAKRETAKEKQLKEEEKILESVAEKKGAYCSGSLIICGIEAVWAQPRIVLKACSCKTDVRGMSDGFFFFNFRRNIVTNALFTAALMGVAELAKGIQYSDPIKTGQVLSYSLSEGHALHLVVGEVISRSGRPTGNSRFRWKPPRYILAMPEARHWRVRKKLHILTEGEDLPPPLKTFKVRLLWISQLNVWWNTCCLTKYVQHSYLLVCAFFRR